MTDPPPQPDRRRHGLWLFAAAMVLVAAVGVSFLLPYYEQWKAVKEIEAAGGSVRAESVGPEWLHDWLPEEWSSALSRVSSAHANDFESFSDEQLGGVCELGEIRSLRLTQTQVSDRGLQHLANLSNLKLLSLEGTHISDAGLTHLTGLSNLDRLWLGGTRISDAGLKHLGSLSKLKYLSLNGTRISDDGLKHLSSLSKLELLSLQETQVTPAGVKQLKAALPGCMIVY